MLSLDEAAGLARMARSQLTHAAAFIATSLAANFFLGWVALSARLSWGKVVAMLVLLGVAYIALRCSTACRLRALELTARLDRELDDGPH